MKLRTLFTFPDPVNEVSARLVAGGVVVLAVMAIAFQQRWLVALLAYGFVARVLTGPKLSPLGLLVTTVVTPRLPLRPKFVPGPPKRFAQAIGATLSLAAVIVWFGFDQPVIASVLVGAIVFAATLESVFAFCLGCALFGLLMKAGVIPDEVCERCNNLSLGRGEPKPDAAMPAKPDGVVRV
ncbi:MAG: glutaredoxin/malate transporter fusion protein [Actinomycetia bacterium]|nr:glutaredoxin/malate transporter fusion protein [Actinomycetes bacterium]